MCGIYFCVHAMDYTSIICLISCIAEEELLNTMRRKMEGIYTFPNLSYNSQMAILLKHNIEKDRIN